MRNICYILFGLLVWVSPTYSLPVPNPVPQSLNNAAITAALTAIFTRPRPVTQTTTGVANVDQDEINGIQASTEEGGTPADEALTDIQTEGGTPADEGLTDTDTIVSSIQDASGTSEGECSYGTCPADDTASTVTDDTASQSSEDSYQSAGDGYNSQPFPLDGANMDWENYRYTIPGMETDDAADYTESDDQEGVITTGITRTDSAENIQMDGLAATTVDEASLQDAQNSVGMGAGGVGQMGSASDLYGMDTSNTDATDAASDTSSSSYQSASSDTGSDTYP